MQKLVQLRQRRTRESKIIQKKETVQLTTIVILGILMRCCLRWVWLQYPRSFRHSRL